MIQLKQEFPKMLQEMEEQMFVAICENPELYDQTKKVK